MLIEECSEPLVSLNAFGNQQIIVLPEYWQRGIPGALNDCYVREGVAKRLAEAACALPNGYKLVILDGWRPISVQMSLYQLFREKIKAENPEFPEQRVSQLVESYVSLPSNDRLKPSPHITGGAVDLSIQDKSGRMLEMGSNFDEFSKISFTRYFEEQIEHGDILDQLEKSSLDNRRLLFYVLSNVGFTNYAEEWWHYDFGNQFWGAITGQPAIYGRATLLRSEA